MGTTKHPSSKRREKRQRLDAPADDKVAEAVSTELNAIMSEKLSHARENSSILTTKVEASKRLNVPTSKLSSSKNGIDYDSIEDKKDGYNDDDFSPRMIEEELLGFCCYTCRCPPNRDDYLPHEKDGRVHRYIQSCEDGLYHRCCCHGISEVNEIEDWATLYEAAIEQVGMVEPDHFSKVRSVTSREIYNAYEKAMRQESVLYNADGDAHPLDRLMTHPSYLEDIVKPFERLTKRVDSGTYPRRSAVVLDLFAGIGSGVLALKRLGIKISKIIHVEHDKIATHVYRWNHDPSYNTSLQEDGIEHVYILKWENFEDEWESLCETHGPVDIVLGAPPYCDISLVGKDNNGIDEEGSRFMLKLGRCIRMMEQKQKPHPLFFLVEYLFCDKNPQRMEIMKAFGFDWDPFTLNSKYLSPTRRNQHFITNIPLPNIDFTSEISMQGPESCLEPGFFLAAHLVDPEISAKAPNLMASDPHSEDRQSLRLFVYEKTGNDAKIFFGRPMNPRERENLMGFPAGYVDIAVKGLFDILVRNALSRTLLSDERWKHSLDEKYHTFSGNYHNLKCFHNHQYEVKTEEPFVFLKMAPPSTVGDPCFFNVEGYTMRLIGMAQSIPVLTSLLEPLSKVFQMKEYADFQYPFNWELETVYL